MSSFFGRLKNSGGTSGPNISGSPAKKDSNPAHAPLETLLAEAGPIRSDGSDKFFGIQNPSNTCYCNSVVQCLYFSEPFRKHVINFPRPSSSDPLGGLGIEFSGSNATSGNAAVHTSQPGKSQFDSSNSTAPRKAPVISSTPNLSGNKVDETNKESFDYLKRQAIQSGNFTDINYDNSQKYGMQTSLFTGLKDLFEAIVAQRSRVGVFALNRFLQTLRENFDTFRTPLHQDAHEFLNILLNDVVTRVGDHTKKTMEAVESSGSEAQEENVAAESNPLNSNEFHKESISWVHELFEGTLTSETRCLTCENISRRDEAFLDLSVDLDEHSSVTSCLRRFSEEEMLCERNKFHCDKCGGLQEAEKRMKIKKLPRILALHLKRFKYTEELGRLQKLFHRVMFPFHLRLFNTTDDTDDPDRLYELYAIIVHLGSTPFHGHYVSIIKTRDFGWLLFDDELVLPVDKDYVRNFFGGDPRNPACAYVLFYQETTFDTVVREQQTEYVSETASTAHHMQDPAFIGSKANGTISPSGATTATPSADNLDGVESLEHAVTEPPQPSVHPLSTPVLETVTSLPNPLSQVPLEAPIVSKKERAKEEKERKAAEKEVEKQAKQKRKDEDTQSPTAEYPTSHVKTGSFSRFRPSSLSLRQRQRPKFWGPRDKSETLDTDHDSQTVEDPVQSLAPTSAPKRNSTDAPTALPLVHSEKPKQNRFSMAKKKSSLV